MTKIKKKIGKRIIKKLKAIEIKKEPFKKLDPITKKEIKEEKPKEDSEFHEDILQKSIELEAPVIKNNEMKVPGTEIEQEPIENLEEFASTLPSRRRESDEKPYSTNNAYGTIGSGSGTYDSDKRYDASEKYDTDFGLEKDRGIGMRKEVLTPFSNPNFSNKEDERGKEGLAVNRLEESARLNQQYRREREDESRRASGAHQSRGKRELF